MRNRGQIQTIEAVISIAIIGIILMILFTKDSKTLENIHLSRKLEVYDTLKIIDLTQNLRIYAINRNITKIEEILYPYLKFNFRVAIFNSTTNITVIPNIEANDIIVVSYLISGYLDRYEPLEIRVYLW